MARLLIPTRNRPASLRSVIAFLERFHPGTRVIVADGSADAFARQNAGAMAEPGLRVEVEYRRYPYETPFFDRLLDVLESIDDPFVIMGSDDDFPLMDALGRAEKALAADPEASTAMGSLLHFFLKSPTELQVRLGLARPIMAADAEKRARAYASWSFSTTYAVTRRELLIERYRRARDLFLVGFYDFGVGLHDCMHGRIRALPEIGFIATRNYNHSYLRPEDRLVFLRRSADVLRMTARIAEDLQRFGGLSGMEAESASEEMIRRRVAENAGAPAHRMRGFENTRLFLNPVVQRQLRLFNDIFDPACADAHGPLRERLRCVVDSLRNVAQSTDNAGEDHTVETLDGQMSDAAGARSSPKTPAPPVRIGRQPDDLIRLVRNVDPDSLCWSERRRFQTVHILALGQSNIANHGFPTMSSPFGGAMFRGERRPMADPIPGGSGEGGSVWPRLADRVAASGMAEDLLVTLRAVGGTSIGDWSEGGAQFDALMADLPEIATASPPVTHVLWHQGERDTLLGTSAETYEARLTALHAAVSRRLPDAVWIVCRASHRAGVRSDAVRAGQDAFIARAPRCVAGPITDQLGAAFRYDDTHFNAQGLLSFSQMLADALRAATIAAEDSAAITAA